MTQLANPVEPFGEVNVFPKGANNEIVATILMVPDIEGAKAGLALDGSASMKKMYGISGMVSNVFAQASGMPNVVEPVAKTMAKYLANFSANGKTRIIYWACSPDGSQIEEIGDFGADDLQQLTIGGPKKQQWGRFTELLPPVKYFTEQVFKDSQWAICIFVTDGIIKDIEEVKTYCLNFAKEISSGRRSFIKYVLIGVGEEIDEGQMEELDDMFEGTGIKDPAGEDIDLWDHKLARDMKKIEEIFAEVVSENAIVAGSGKIYDSFGKIVKEYADGVPSLLRFSMPSGSTSFTLEIADNKITQDIATALK
jgi:hypothetical protein